MYAPFKSSFLWSLKCKHLYLARRFCGKYAAGDSRKVLESNQKAWSAGELPPEEIVFGLTEPMKAIRQKIQKVAGSDLPILIQGENGTGKEILAKYVHTCSGWAKGNFVKVNCAAIPGTLLESELFGYEQGAFTGAHMAKAGRVELADGGTLFLDEIVEIDMGLQAKLLQVLQDGRFSRIGGHEERRVSTRVICATNRRIEEEVEKGRFRGDLFYRIDGVRLTMPPLRERKEDLESLAGYFLAFYCLRFQKNTIPLQRHVLHMLERHDWPGNIRELENWAARCALLGLEDAMEIYAGGTKQGIAAAGPGSGPVHLRRMTEKICREREQEFILKVLEEHQWNRRRTAEALKISYRTLLYKLRETGVSTQRKRKAASVSHSSATPN